MTPDRLYWIMLLEKVRKLLDVSCGKCPLIRVAFWVPSAGKCANKIELQRLNKFAVVLAEPSCIVQPAPKDSNEIQSMRIYQLVRLAP